MTSLEDHFKISKQAVFSQMLGSRKEKYKWFLRALCAFKYASADKTRGTFLESYYILMRYVDDVVDKDAPLPTGFASSADYVKEKIEFAANPINPKDSADYLMQYCIELSKQMGQDFTHETQDILSSMLFDAKRIGTSHIFPENELEHHFYKLDIRGTVGATLKIFKEDPSKLDSLIPLGTACRIFYNLRDYIDDLDAGLINISTQDCERFAINNRNISNKNSREVRAWFNQQASTGLNLLETHRQTIGLYKFGTLARITFPLVYEQPARQFFKRVLSESHNN